VIFLILKEEIMGEFFNQLENDIQEHIREISKNAGLIESEESLELMAEAWVEKEKIFKERTESIGMEELDYIEKDDSRGALVLTYSGSLINIGPQSDGIRAAEYTSIGLRTDVPDSAENGSSKLATDINIGEELEFETGPVKSTSQIFKIAVCNSSLSYEDQEDLLGRATVMITDEFANVNKTLVME